MEFFGEWELTLDASACLAGGFDFSEKFIQGLVIMTCRVYCLWASFRVSNTNLQGNVQKTYFPAFWLRHRYALPPPPALGGVEVRLQTSEK